MRGREKALQSIRTYVMTYKNILRMLKGLEKLQKKCEEGGTKLINILLGQSDLSTPQIMDDIQFFDETLNDSQKEAVRFALCSPEIALIHGPPGVSL
jgi:DNA polymerase alpha-associated DNA helicase A